MPSIRSLEWRLDGFSLPGGVGLDLDVAGHPAQDRVAAVPDLALEDGRSSSRQPGRGRRASAGSGSPSRRSAMSSVASCVAFQRSKPISPIGACARRELEDVALDEGVVGHVAGRRDEVAVADPVGVGHAVALRPRLDAVLGAPEPAQDVVHALVVRATMTSAVRSWTDARSSPAVARARRGTDARSQSQSVVLPLLEAGAGVPLVDVDRRVATPSGRSSGSGGTPRACRAIASRLGGLLAQEVDLDRDAEVRVRLRPDRLVERVVALVEGVDEDEHRVVVARPSTTATASARSSAQTDSRFTPAVVILTIIGCRRAEVAVSMLSIESRSSRTWSSSTIAPCGVDALLGVARVAAERPEERRREPSSLMFSAWP
jgi:hypothetical protein